jgi:hypothetical protein
MVGDMKINRHQFLRSLRMLGGKSPTKIVSTTTTKECVSATIGTIHTRTTEPRCSCDAFHDICLSERALRYFIRTRKINLTMKDENGRVQDIFSSELNRCTAQDLPLLRLERESTHPIVCYESEDDEENSSASDKLKSVIQRCPHAPPSHYVTRSIHMIPPTSLPVQGRLSCST